MAISKKVRFEVFKRDSFTCQYCGRKAPDVVLQADHIEPTSKGGSDDYLNLTTSCVECNQGKSDRKLDDQSAVARQRKQLEDLQERQEQISMMLQWQRTLVDLDQEAVNEAASFWCSLADWYAITEDGKTNLRKLVRRYGLDAVLYAMRNAVDYFKHNDDGSLTPESTEKAFSKIGGIIRITEAEAEKPWLREMFYTRGIVRNRMHCVDYVAKEILEQAYEAGIPTEVSRRVALDARSWTAWKDEMYDLLDSWEPGG
jgi:hypothetical protein